MASSSTDLRSKLARVKGLGAAHHGVGPWWFQRVTAVALVPLSLWFVYSTLSVMREPTLMNAVAWFASPVNTLIMCLLIVTTFFHAKLGMQVVIEDYVKHPAAKYALLLGNTFVCVIFATVTLLAVLKLHLIDLVGAV